ncbi:MAG: redoxin domain-containing protein, partial [Pyrinomonadaceae bacterium]
LCLVKSSAHPLRQVVLTCGRHWLRLVGIGLGITLSLLFPPLLERAGSRWPGGPIARAQGDDGSYDEEFQKGLEFLRRRKYEEALKTFKRANEMHGKKSAECFFGMAQAYDGLEAFKNVIESCDKAIEFSGSNTELRARAYNLKGLAIREQSEGKDQKKLQAAEAVFRDGLALGADLPILHYNLGFVLMQQNRDPEGVAALQKYVELEPKGSFVDTARKVIENPRRAREAYAPDFSITTSDGEYIQLEDLRGKVVVLDFWGTWCPPCVESVPSLRSLHKRYAKEPSFVMIAISSDSDEEPWREFIAKEKMVWPQYWDRDHRVQRAFSVRAFPTYIVIDHEGIMRFRTSGSSWVRAANLEDAIKKQVKIVAKTASAN